MLITGFKVVHHRRYNIVIIGELFVEPSLFGADRRGPGDGKPALPYARSMWHRPDTRTKIADGGSLGRFTGRLGEMDHER